MVHECLEDREGVLRLDGCDDLKPAGHVEAVDERRASAADIRQLEEVDRDAVGEVLPVLTKSGRRHGSRDLQAMADRACELQGGLHGRIAATRQPDRSRQRTVRRVRHVRVKMSDGAKRLGVGGVGRGTLVLINRKSFMGFTRARHQGLDNGVGEGPGVELGALELLAADVGGVRVGAGAPLVEVRAETTPVRDDAPLLQDGLVARCPKAVLASVEVALDVEDLTERSDGGRVPAVVGTRPLEGEVDAVAELGDEPLELADHAEALGLVDGQSGRQRGSAEPIDPLVCAPWSARKAGPHGHSSSLPKISLDDVEQLRDFARLREVDVV